MKNENPDKHIIMAEDIRDEINEIWAELEEFVVENKPASKLPVEAFRQIQHYGQKLVEARERLYRVEHVIIFGHAPKY